MRMPGLVNHMWIYHHNKSLQDFTHPDCLSSFHYPIAMLIAILQKLRDIPHTCNNHVIVFVVLHLVDFGAPFDLRLLTIW